MTHRRRGAWLAAAFVAGFVALLLGTGRPLNFFDEAWMLVGGRRWLAGELPFRDFYALYPPGQYAISAALLALRDDVMTLRVGCVAVRAAIAVALLAAVHRLGGRVAAAAAWAASLAWLFACGSYGYPVFAALLLALAALLTLAPGMPVAPGRAALAGAAVGAAALFRHDVGAYALAASVPLLVAAGARAALAFAAGTAVTFGVPAAWFLANAPVERIEFELFTYPATRYAAMRGRPYPPLLAAPLTADVLVSPRRLGAVLANGAFHLPALFAMAAAVVAWRGRAADRVASGLLFGLAILTAGAVNLARIRCDVLQVAAAALLGVTLAAILAARAARSGRRALGCAVGAAGLVLLVWPLHAMRSIPVGLPGGGAPDPQHAANLAAGSARREAAAYLASVVPEGERVFVACGRHDKVFVNEPILYYLADRLPGSYYHAFDPGVITTETAQETVVSDLERNRVRYVAVATGFDDWREPNASAEPTGATVLDAYLRANYAEDRRFNAVLSVWRRTTTFR